jgi:phosphohistidine phosphatase
VERRLFVLRHAKSSWDDPDLADHDRPLNARGRASLPAIEALLRERAGAIEVVLCSSAVRTVATLEGVARALATDAVVTIDDQLYGAHRDRWLARCRGVPDETLDVLLVGHNPGVEDLVRSLVRTAEPAALHQLVTKVPTGALAELLLDGPWSELATGTCHLTGLWLPPRTPG